MNKSTYKMGVKAYVRPEMQIVEASIASLVCVSLNGAEAADVVTEGKGGRGGSFMEDSYERDGNNYGDLWQ